MLPLRGRRLEVSKSNSVSLVPSTTTTRVSSGWLASMSMRRAMGSLPRRWGPTGASDQRPCRLSGARGTVRFDPSNGQLEAKMGKLRAAEPNNPGPADLEVPVSHRLTGKPLGTLARLGTAVGARPPKRALRTTATAREAQHTVFALTRQTKSGT